MVRKVQRTLANTTPNGDRGSADTAISAPRLPRKMSDNNFHDEPIMFFSPQAPKDAHAGVAAAAMLAGVDINHTNDLTTKEATPKSSKDDFSKLVLTNFYTITDSPLLPREWLLQLLSPG